MTEGIPFVDEHHGIDVLVTCSCPCCAQTAQRWFIERAEDGSFSTYAGISCQACGLETGSFPGDP